MSTTQVMREEFATFLKVPAGSDGTYNIMGEGITDLSISYNAKTDDVHYIHEKTARTNLTAFAPNTGDIEMEAFSGDPIFDYVDGLRKSLATGSAVKTKALLVNIYDKTGDTYSAQEFDASVTVGEIGGAGGEGLKITYSVSFEGNPKAGTATIAAGVATFTASV